MSETGLSLTKDEAAHLARLEARVETGLATFVDVGMALVEIRERRLYRATHGTFESYCRGRWHIAASRARQLIGAAEVVRDLESVTTVTPGSERVARCLAPLDPEQREAIWKEAVETAPDGRVTAAHVERIKNLLSSASVEWYTPSQYVEAARRVLGGIDLDPASCAAANETIRAATFYDLEKDGLIQEWRGRVFLNPPYGGQAGAFIERLLQHRRAGRVEAAVVLVNAHATDTGWFQPLWSAALLCFTDHRLRFGSPSGTANGNTCGSIFGYFGPHEDRFIEEFRRFGPVVKCVAFAEADATEAA